MELKESQTVELKKSLSQLDDALKSICAFLNHKGGTVYFGVDDKGNVIGLEVSDKTLRKISQQIISRIKPEIAPEIKEVGERGRSIIQVKVPEGSNKPYFLNGIAYKKIGSEKRVIPPDELKRIILEQKQMMWDEEICESATLNDIDDEKLKWFLRKAKTERNFDVEPETPLKEALERLKLVKDGKPINASILLFGKNPQKFFLQAEIRCARFKGTEPVKPFIDMKVFSGNIIKQVDDALNFVLEHVPMAAWLVPGKVAREEKYTYPSDAVREAIVNAICHRDYESPGNVQVRVFDDRLEVWNPGQLPTGWTVERLKQKHESIPKNSLIADQFFLIKFIEKWGTETNDIIRECLDWGLPEPIFEFTGMSLVVTLRGCVLTEELDKLGLNERQKEIITYLKKHKEITRTEYQKIFNISERTANRELSKLVDLGIILKKGLGVKTYYTLASFGELWRAISKNLNDLKSK